VTGEQGRTTPHPRAARQQRRPDNGRSTTHVPPRPSRAGAQTPGTRQTYLK